MRATAGPALDSDPGSAPARVRGLDLGLARAWGQVLVPVSVLGLVQDSAPALVQGLAEEVARVLQEYLGIVGREVRRRRDDLGGRKPPVQLRQKIGKSHPLQAAMRRAEQAAGLPRRQEFAGGEARVTTRPARWP